MPVIHEAADFKSDVSTYFTTRALMPILEQKILGKTIDEDLFIPNQSNINWRRDPESNWARRICNPLHNRFAIAP
jgi:hypothetical protein